MQSELTLLEQIKSGKIWDFPGGIHPPEQKSLSNQGDITPISVKTVYVPVAQHIGQVGEVIVRVGDQVLKGQPLTAPLEGFSLPVHAPVSGIVKHIGNHVSAHPSGLEGLTVEIEADGLDAAITPAPLSNWQQLDKAEVADRLKQFGIAGLGGAAFPTYVKMQPSKDIDVLIINAVECEPYITADDVLMRYHSDDIVTGIKILQHLVGAKAVLVGIEDNKPEAISAMEKASANSDDIHIRVVPTKYPSGGEKQLIQVLTNREVPTGGIPADIGIVMQNTGTCFAVKQAIIDGVPLTQRVVTVTGDNVSSPQNLWVPLGTPVRSLLEFVGFAPEKRQKLIMGGPMMGFNIMNDLMPVVKSTNCILVPSSSELPERGVEQACIRCGLCADACPAELLPQQLQWFAKAKDHEKLEEYNLFDCIECGACSYVCPSQIPLVQYYRIGKAEIREEREEKIKSDKAKKRFEERQARLEREKEERLQRHKEAAEKRKKALEKDDSAKDKIAAALARAKAKKQEPAESQADEPQDKVAAAIARAKAKKAEKQAEQDKAANSQADASGSGDAQKDKVAAAIARAKAKKAEKQAQQEQADAVNEANAAPEAESAEDAQKAKVAAAIARAKAKKAEKQAQQEQADAVNDANAAPEAESAEDAKKAKVAAAIARAKAKKAEQQAQQEQGAEATTGAEVETTEPELSAEQERKAKVAAAIAKAKAKQQAEKTEIPTEQPASEAVETAPESKSADELRKEKVAAAIAKAKAKKLAAEQAGKDKE